MVHILYKSGGCTVQHDTQIVNYIYKLQDDETFEFKSTRKKIASIRGRASKKLRDQVNSSQVVLAYQVNSSQVVLAFCRALSLNLHTLQPTQSANLANNNLGSRYRKEQKYGFAKSEKRLYLTTNRHSKLIQKTVGNISLPYKKLKPKHKHLIHSISNQAPKQSLTSCSEDQIS